MAEPLSTMSNEDFDRFVAAPVNTRHSFSTQCDVYSAKKCPDQTLKKPRCGVCVIAKQDQLIMIGDIKAKGFKVIDEPEKLWYTDNIMTSRLQNRATIFEIIHSAGDVELKLSSSK